MPLINCEVLLTLAWSANCALTNIVTHGAVAAQGDNFTRTAINTPTNAAFKIIDKKQNCMCQ